MFYSFQHTNSAHIFMSDLHLGISVSTLYYYILVSWQFVLRAFLQISCDCLHDDHGVCEEPQYHFFLSNLNVFNFIFSPYCSCTSLLHSCDKWPRFCLSTRSSPNMFHFLPFSCVVVNPTYSYHMLNLHLALFLCMISGRILAVH